MDELMNIGGLKDRGKRPRKYIEKKQPSKLSFFNFFTTKSQEMKEKNIKVDVMVRRQLANTWRSMKPEEKAKYAGSYPCVKVGCREVKHDFCGLKPIITQCRPDVFKDVVSTFSDERKAAVEEMGFGLLLQLRCDQLQCALCGWLVDRFDPDASSIEVHGKTFKLKPSDFENIMGVKDGGHDVELSDSEDNNIHGLKIIRCGKERSRISMREIVKRLRQTNIVDDTFRVGFVLFLLGTLLCPSSIILASKYLQPLRETSDIKFKNWATFSFKYLVEGVSSFKNRKRSCVINGCVLFLQLFYFDLIVHGRTFVNRSLAPIVSWGDKEANELIKWIRTHKGGFESVDITVVSDRTALISKEDEVALKNGLGSVHIKVTANERMQRKTNDEMKVAELEAKLDSEMSKIEGLTYWQVFQATNILATRFDLLSVFLPMSQERKKDYVLCLLEHGTHGL
ncbi:hypothetical protein ABKV19_000233 [Rosa sericea]